MVYPNFNNNLALINLYNYQKLELRIYIYIYIYMYCYGDISYHIPKIDSSNLNIFSELARSGMTTSRFLRDI